MTALEIVAAAFGVVSVWLGARQRIWVWPTGMVNVGLYIVVFFHERLYADMGLQSVYLVLCAYGWHQWLHGGARRTPLHVTRASPRLLAGLLVLNLVAWGVMGTLLSRYSNAVLPWLDSLLTTTSLVAQWLMTRKVLESWLVWLAVDVVYIPMFISRGLYPTAALYAIFLMLALLGWRDWSRSLDRDADAPEGQPGLTGGGTAP